MTNSRIRHVNLDSNEPDFKKRALETDNAIVDRLRLLLRIAEAVEIPCFAVSTQDFVGLILQLGALLQNLEAKNGLNDEVFEDPHQVADVLGNIKMIHKKMSATDLGLLKRLGKEIAFLCHNVLQQYRQSAGSNYIWSEIDLDPSDDVGSEDLLAAKRLISSLRRENSRLDRRNEALYLENDRLSRQVAKLCPVPSGQASLKGHYPVGWKPHSFGSDFEGQLQTVGIYEDGYPDLKVNHSKISYVDSFKPAPENEKNQTYDEKMTTNPEHFTCTEEDGKHNSMPRKHRVCKQSESSQKDFSFGE